MSQFVRVTHARSGDTGWVNLDTVFEIRATTERDMQDNFETPQGTIILILGGTTYIVQETPEQLFSEEGRY